VGEGGPAELLSGKRGEGGEEGRGREGRSARGAPVRGGEEQGGGIGGHRVGRKELEECSLISLCAFGKNRCRSKGATPRH
jgi:hypothetical protein